MAPNTIPGSYERTNENIGKTVQTPVSKEESIDGFVDDIINTASNPDAKNYQRENFPYTHTFNDLANYLQEKQSQNPYELDISEMTTGDVNVKVDPEKLAGAVSELFGQYKHRKAESESCSYRNDGFTMDVAAKDPQTTRTLNLAAAMLAYGVTNGKMPDADGCRYASVSRDIDNGGITFYFSKSPGPKYMN